MSSHSYVAGSALAVIGVDSRHEVAMIAVTIPFRNADLKLDSTCEEEEGLIAMGRVQALHGVRICFGNKEYEQPSSMRHMQHASDRNPINLIFNITTVKSYVSYVRNQSCKVDCFVLKSASSSVIMVQGMCRLVL